MKYKYLKCQLSYSCRAIAQLLQLMADRRAQNLKCDYLEAVHQLALKNEQSLSRRGMRYILLAVEDAPSREIALKLEETYPGLVEFEEVSFPDRQTIDERSFAVAEQAYSN